MNKQKIIKSAIFNIGGPTEASKQLGVSLSTIGNWVRKGQIPKLKQAKKVAQQSGIPVHQLRSPHAADNSACLSPNSDSTFKEAV